MMHKESGTPLRKEHYNSIKGLIDAIGSDPNAEPFLDPVPW